MDKVSYYSWYLNVCNRGGRIRFLMVSILEMSIQLRQVYINSGLGPYLIESCLTHRQPIQQYTQSLPTPFHSLPQRLLYLTNRKAFLAADISSSS